MPRMMPGARLSALPLGLSLLLPGQVAAAPLISHRLSSVQADQVAAGAGTDVSHTSPLLSSPGKADAPAAAASSQGSESVAPGSGLPSSAVPATTPIENESRGSSPGQVPSASERGNTEAHASPVTAPNDPPAQGHGSAAGSRNGPHSAASGGANWPAGAFAPRTSEGPDPHRG